MGTPPRDIDPKHFPLLFAFANITDPTSGYLVNRRDLFGPEASGYSLESVTIQITDDLPNDGNIAEVLPWLADWKGHIRPFAETAPDYLPPIDKVAPIGTSHFAQTFLR